MVHSEFLSSPEEIIEDARNGRMFILVDDEGRENEGDLVIPAQMVTPDVINFMARFGRGLICLAMTKARVDELGLPLMSASNGTRHQTAFTVSIEAREGVSTGISAADRARTVHAAIDGSRGPEAIVTPGHIFPLCACDGGVLVRAGHTEASVDIARIAGLNPAGVICEIMNDDGTMARMDDLIPFAREHGLKIGTIADLISYRIATDRMTSCASTTIIDTVHSGEWALKLYHNRFGHQDSIALVKGELDTSQPVLVRMHTLSMVDDMFGRKGDRNFLLQAGMREIDRAGSGIIVLIRHTESSAFSDILAHTVEAEPMREIVLRDYGIGAQILTDLGVKDMVLLTNSRRHQMIGLDGYGLNVVEERPIPLDVETLAL